jgi:hypothetical protein
MIIISMYRAGHDYSNEMSSNYSNQSFRMIEMIDFVLEDDLVTG